MADLEADLRTPSSNWIDSGGTYDPMLQGPAHSFPVTDPDYYIVIPQWRPRSRIARTIELVSAVAFAAFVIGVIFFLEPLTAIFYR